VDIPEEKKLGTRARLEEGFVDFKARGLLFEARFRKMRGKGYNEPG